MSSQSPVRQNHAAQRSPRQPVTVVTLGDTAHLLENHLQKHTDASDTSLSTCSEVALLGVPPRSLFTACQAATGGHQGIGDPLVLKAGSDILLSAGDHPVNVPHPILIEIMVMAENQGLRRYSVHNPGDTDYQSLLLIRAHLRWVLDKTSLLVQKKAGVRLVVDFRDPNCSNLRVEVGREIGLKTGPVAGKTIQIAQLDPDPTAEGDLQNVPINRTNSSTMATNVTTSVHKLLPRKLMTCSVVAQLIGSLTTTKQNQVKSSPKMARVN